MFGTAQGDVEAFLDALAPDPAPGWLGPLRWVPDEHGNDVPRPVWSLVDGAAVVDEDADPDEAREAWQAAAEWTQGELDDLGTLVRVQDVALSRGLLLAYRTSLRDARFRFGAAQGHRGSQAARLFFQQTGLQLGMRPGQVAHRIDTLEVLEGSMPGTWAAYTSWTASWQAVDLAVRMGEGLTAEQTGAYDVRVAAVVGTTPFASLKRKLRKIRADVRKDDAPAVARRCSNGGPW